MRRVTHFPQFVAPAAPPPTFESIGDGGVIGHTEASVRLRTTEALVEVTALAPDVFRVGLFSEGLPVEYHSEAVVDGEWPTHPVQIDLDPVAVRLTTTHATASISLQPLRVGFSDR